MKKNFPQIFFYFFLFSRQVFPQTDVAILSEKVGTEIDIHENRFYRVFPKERGFISAQIINLEEGKFRITIVKEINGAETKVRRYIDKDEFERLKSIVNRKPVFTAEEKIKMYEGMDFLRAEKIINEIPKPQFIKIKHSGNKKLKGTLLEVKNNILHIQGPSLIEKIHLNTLDKISYRTTVGKYDRFKNHFYVITGIVGFLGGYYYSSQRAIIYNDYPNDNVPRTDISFYRYINGIIIGLIFSGEVFDAVSTLLTSSDTIILSEAEYEKVNYN